jgi:hypothetical protein
LLEEAAPHIIWRSAQKDRNAAMRADFKKGQAELARKSVERAADEAENDAAVAVSLATYYIDGAEWAAVQVELARRAADQLARRS